MMLAGLVLVAAAPLVNLQSDVDMRGPPQSVYLIERELAKGEDSGLHLHHGVEMNVLVQGTVRVTVQGQAPRVMHEGDSITIPRETPHDAVNIGDGPARIVITYVVDKGRPLKEPVSP
ncbi:MAG TPA: cupin domain-containing protein [Rhizomicrobium sp.]|nr:cupin domain-containing protein [Rhizomicrobium sp.]